MYLTRTSVEYMAVQLYFAAEYEQCIDLCRTIHLGSGLDREMADLNLRAALKAGSTRDVLDVVEESRQWVSQHHDLEILGSGLTFVSGAVPQALPILQRQFTDKRLGSPVNQACFPLVDASDALSACLYSVNERGLSTEPLKELSSIIKAWGAKSDISEALREALMQLSLVHSLASRDASDHLASEVSNPEIVLTSQPNSADDGVSRIATILWGAESSANEELLRAFVKRVFALSRSLPTDSVPDRSVRTL